MSREAFGQGLLLDFLKFKLEDVLYLQLNNLERSFEVTFFKNADCQQALKGCREQAEVTVPISLFEVTSLDRPNFRLITVHMYNPHVTDQAITAFLGWRRGEADAGFHRLLEWEEAVPGPAQG